MDLSLSKLFFDLLQVVLPATDCAATLPLDVDGCAVLSEFSDLFLVLLCVFDSLTSFDVEIDTCALSSEVSDFCHVLLLFFAALFSFDFEVEVCTLSSEVSDDFLFLRSVLSIFVLVDLDFFQSFVICSDMSGLCAITFVASSWHSKFPLLHVAYSFLSVFFDISLVLCSVSSSWSSTPFLLCVLIISSASTSCFLFFSGIGLV